MSHTTEGGVLTTTTIAAVDANIAVGGQATPSPAGPRMRVKDLAKPLGWYVDWVRSNPDGASSLTRFSRTFAMLVSEPSDLVQMELCWGAAKVHANVNEAILYTANRRVTMAEVITLLLGATQEVECLMELLVRKYKGNAAAWNTMLGLETVKSVLNLCIHRQLFLVPWIWRSVQLCMRRVVRRVYRLVASPGGSRRHALLGSRSTTASCPPSDRKLIGGGTTLVGEVAGPGGVHLVIPRVLSEGRRHHPHAFYPEQEGGDVIDAGTDAKDADEDADEKEAREMLETVHFTWVDVLGMLVDCYLLVRPVALVWAARRRFPKTAEAESIGKPPVLPSARVWAEEQDKANKAAAAAAAAQGLPAPKPQKSQPMPTVIDHIMRAAPSHSLCADWRLWGVFVAIDFLVALLSRAIRRHRVPVVYIDAQGHCAAAGEGGVELSTEAATSVGDDGRPVRPLPTPPAEVDEDGQPVAGAAVQVRRSEVPPVVSRDSLRLQQATRNAAYNFLRDPFFSATLRQLLYDYFVEGFLNRIPLVGAILSYQVSYYLSMQHYSFLYTVGQ